MTAVAKENVAVGQDPGSPHLGGLGDPPLGGRQARAPIVCKWLRAGHATCDTPGSVCSDSQDQAWPNIVLQRKTALYVGSQILSRVKMAGSGTSLEVHLLWNGKARILAERFKIC